MESRQGRAAASAGREIRLGEESVDRPPDQPTFPVLSVPSGTTIAPPGGAIAGHEGRTPESRSSMARFRACWVTHVESGCAVTPATCTRREARAGPGRDRRRPRTIGAFSRRHKEATHDEHQADHRGPAHFACRKLASDNIHEPPPFPVTQDAAGSCGWLGPVVANRQERRAEPRPPRRGRNDRQGRLSGTGNPAVRAQSTHVCRPRARVSQVSRAQATRSAVKVSYSSTTA